MTQINLPNKNITGDNLWSQVEANDQAIADIVNGQLDNSNIAVGADISGAKFLDSSIPQAKLSEKIKTAKLDLSTHFANGTIKSGSLSTQDLVSVSGVVPGIYHLVCHTTGITGATFSNPTTTAGVATYFSAVPGGTLTSGFSAIAIVTSTATITIRGVFAGSNIYCSLTLYGIKS